MVDTGLECVRVFFFVIIVGGGESKKGAKGNQRRMLTYMKVCTTAPDCPRGGPKLWDSRGWGWGRVGKLKALKAFQASTWVRLPHPNLAQIFFSPPDLVRSWPGSPSPSPAPPQSSFLLPPRACRESLPRYCPPHILPAYSPEF